MLRCACELLIIGLGFTTKTAFFFSGFVLCLLKRLVSHSLAPGDSSEGLFANPSTGGASKSRAKTTLYRSRALFSLQSRAPFLRQTGRD